jgi:hypothetical protein
VEKTAASRIGAGSAAVLLIMALVACTTPRSQPMADPAVPPPDGVGAGVRGVNPDIASTPGAITSTVTYGPWTVPAAVGTDHGQEGMLENKLAFGVAKPCTNCYVTNIQATLKYADGRPANIDTGQWLHHMLLASSARTDAICSLSVMGLIGERFFASGNERTRARFPAGYGYPVGTWDSWTLVYDLMNASMAPSNVKIEMTYQWVPRTTPSMKPVRPVWLDVGPCGQADVPAGTGTYQFSRDWTVNRPGKVIGIGAHLHDGGTHLTVKNETAGQVVCTSVAGYGGPGYEDPEGAMDHGQGAGQSGSPPSTDGHGHTDVDHARLHLSSMTQCLAPTGDQPVALLASGQRVSITAYYDADKHPQHGGHPVMGIAILYTAPA